MAQIYATAKEYAANELTFTRGSAADITAVGVAHTVPEAAAPAVAAFTTVTLVEPPDPLAEGDKIDVLSLIGTGGQVELAAGDWQRWILVQTATENIIRKVDVLEVLG